LIRYDAIGFIFGQFLLVFALSMLLPIGVAAYLNDGDLASLAGTAAGVTVLGSLLLGFCPRPTTDLNLREGVLLLVVLWTGVILLGSIPFALNPAFEHYADALFETASGFTTTGATILPDVEVLSPSLQLWRHLMHWLGGMGVILLAIAILPLLGIGSMALYKAQSGTIKSERLRPRIIETARALWKLYVAATVLLYAGLRLAGMGPLDAICHSFSTLSTGGYSTRTASVGAFESNTIEYLIILFMVFASINFTVHFRVLQDRSPFSYLRDLEVRLHLGVLTVCTFLATASLIENQNYGLEQAIRRAAFHIVSIGSTTGFAAENYELWRPFPQMLIFLIGIFGGNTGSTAGGIKSLRVCLALLALQREFKKIVERRGVFTIRVNGQTVPDSQVSSSLALIFIALFVLIGASAMLAATGLDLATSISATTACMFGVGPGFGAVGPAEHYGHLVPFAKVVLSVCMLAGRLEFFTLLLIFSSAFWRK
jgi:trk system potassium uptake protein